MSNLRYYVRYSIAEYERNTAEFLSEKSLIEFLNRHEKFLFLEIIEGRVMKAIPYESTTKWEVMYE